MRKYRHLLDDRFLPWTERRGLNKLHQVSIDSLRQFRQSWTDSPLCATKNLERMRAFFRFCHQGGWIKQNPALAVKPPKVTRTPTLPFSRDDMTRIVDACENYGGNRDRIKAFVLTMRYTGLRIGDTIRLSKTQVSDGKMFVRTAKTGSPLRCRCPGERVACLESSSSEKCPAYNFGALGYLDQRTSLEVAKALADLHRIQIFHVDLNPMNILYRVEQGRPVIRIVDFESSYEVAHHSSGVVYNPPTTSGFCAPEVVDGRVPDGRADVFYLGAVLYTLIAGYGWTWDSEMPAGIDADAELDTDLTTILLTAVERDVDRRYQSIEEMSAALAAYLESIWPGRSWA